ncbi:type I restriction-modification system%2C S subunit [Streptococcus pseudopneumoniae]|uniref:restriction endonuclease subunit S n=4 Tax=Streptococcus TaxID=1301 RepID=UPI0005E38806|nr:restriction endonuclease subunit S [Streptococcus pseudopneumoniae]COD19358.1 type I restriction-modification system%2C S subunit [Streptococcus pseudopneumoniae]
MKKVKLGEICEIVTGSTPKSSNPNYWNGEYKWITPAEISDDDFIVFDTQRKITKLGIEETGLKSFPTGTVLLSSRAPIGKVAISGCEMYCNQGFKNFICSNKINNEYLYYFFKARKNYLNILGRGATFKEISKSIVSDIEIFLPTYDIQRKQVKVLKKIDKLIYTRKEQLIEFEYLVKSRFNEMFGDVILNEKEWKVSKWNEILTIRNGKNQKQVEDADGKFPIYGSGGIMGYAKDWIVKKNSVIIGRKGNINKPILVRENFWNVDTAFGLEPVLEKINSEYLFYFCQLYNFEKLNKAVTIPSLTKSDLLNISIPLPPLALQNEFADFVAQVDKSQFACEIAIKVWRNSLKFSII